MSCLNVPEGRVARINLGSNEASDNRFDVFSMSYYQEELAVFSFLARLFVHLSSMNERLPCEYGSFETLLYCP